MFHFFKKYSKPLFKDLCDIHNHLLPGIDDGSKDVKMSLKMLESYKILGFSSIITTPHIYKELYPNTIESIKNSFQLLLKKNKLKKHPHIHSYAAEYMVDEIFMKNLELAIPNLLLNKKYILVEINFFGGIELLEKACFILLQKDIFPILAHPERYHLIENLQDYQNIKEKGFYFQLNALSLLGHYGPSVKQKAKILLNEGLYDFVATDAHNPMHLQQLDKLKLSKKEGLKWELIREFQLDKFPF
tara:strand:+ start:1956 stop:2690 length:735 start_codon:yes stop_codon:yes gene_type:complete